ncbi:glutamate receptor ionotropic, NMDA 1-like isoform X2 [Actinia tenebrosa]|nr:glutamate receptor ionotropic, NMDA 1-like isoform X2 [Actinia tenebrosa]
MGWRRIGLLTTADQEGLQLATIFQSFSLDENWETLEIAWISFDTNLNRLFQDIVDFKPDLLVIHGQGGKVEIFDAAKFFTCPLLMTSSVFDGILTENTPSGVLKLSLRKVIPDADHHFNVQMLSESMALVQNAFSDTVQKLCENDIDRTNCENALNKRLVREQVSSYISNYSKAGSVFFIPGPKDLPAQVFDIWNLRTDLRGHKYWLEIGMWTPAGIALDSFVIQNEKKFTPSLHNPRPTLRVPVVGVPTWMEVGEPYNNKPEGECLSGKPCYSYEKIGNSNEVTRIKHCCVGAVIDLIILLENDLEFKSYIYFAPDKKWGIYNETSKNWNGLMEQLTTGKGDVTALLGIDKARYQSVGFTQPYMNLGMNILVRKTDIPYFWAMNWKFLEPFKIELWLTITCVSNIFLLVIWGLDRLSPHGHRRRISLLQEEDSPTKDNGFSLLDSMSYVWGVAFSKDIGAENTPRSPSARFVSIFFGFMALILVNTYCANLTAVLMQDKFSSPINGIRDKKLVDPLLYPPDGFQLGVVRGSLEEWYFKNHKDTQIQLLYNVNIKINLVDDYEGGFRQLQDRKLDGLVGDEISLQAQANLANCDYNLIGTKFYEFGVGFAFKKDSPWLHKATLSVLKNQENGTIEHIKKLRFPSKPCEKLSFRRFNIDDFSGLFITVLLVIMFGILALVAELFIIFILIKYWEFLGCFGRKLRYFIFGVKESDRHLIDIQWISAFGRSFGKSWDVNIKTPQASLNNGHIMYQNGFSAKNGIKNDGFFISDDFSNGLFSATRASGRSLTSLHSFEMREETTQRSSHSSSQYNRHKKNKNKSVRIAEANDIRQANTDGMVYSNGTEL